jgi:uncharacterized protein YukE
MALENQVTDVDIQLLVRGMERTDADCDAAQKSVTGCSEYLMSVWKGDAAARYGNALAAWQGGLTKVQLGLRELQAAMSQHYQISNHVEGDASASASWIDTVQPTTSTTPGTTTTSGAPVPADGNAYVAPLI